MKKILLWLLCLTTLFACMPASATEKTYKKDIFTYTVSDKTCTITNVDDVQTTVEIPATLGKYTVTALGDGALGGCSTIEEVVLPTTLTKLGDFCFAYSNSLKKIVFPDSLTSIPDGAFYHCENLWTIALPDSIQTIGKNAFGRCTSLTALSVPESVTSIGENAFPIGEPFCLYSKMDSVPYAYALAHGIAFEEYIHVTVNGKKIVFDQPSITNAEHYRTMVPMRAVLEDLGAEISWDNTFNTAGITVFNTRILIRPNEPFMMVNGTVRYLSCPAIEFNGRIMVPIRDVMESIGGKVNWDEEKKLVSVTVNH